MKIILKEKQFKKFILENKESMSNNNSLYFHNGNETDSWAVIFGGTPSSKYGAIYMYKVSNPFLSDKNVVYSQWENNLTDIIAQLQKKFPESYVNSVSGFSKGGLRAFPETGKFNFVGLIDPSIEGDYTKINPEGTSTIMTYQPDRKWGLVGLKYAISKLGPEKSIPINVGHLEQPQEFYKRFKSLI